MENNTFEAVYKTAGKDDEIRMICNTIDEFLVVADMYVKRVIDIVSVNGVPVVRTSHVEVVDEDKSV